MVDPAADSLSVPSVPRCPWCSAELPASDVKTCPSCNANLTTDSEAQLPGLTALDLERLAFRRATAPKKSRLMSWISGDSDYENASDPVAQPGSLEPPPFEVRREMLRIEMAALIADLTAEAGAMAADEAAANDADPVAAAAAIRAEIDAATRADQLIAEADGTAASVEPAVEPTVEPPLSADATDGVAARPARTRRLGRKTRTAPATTLPDQAEPADSTDPTGAGEVAQSEATAGPETAPS